MFLNLFPASAPLPFLCAPYSSSWYPGLVLLSSFMLFLTVPLLEYLGGGPQEGHIALG